MGWLSDEVEGSIAAWFNSHSADGEASVLASHVMRWTRSTLDGDQLRVTVSIKDLLDGIEGSSEHRAFITDDEWKVVHPLSCRMRGLAHCAVRPPEDMNAGEYSLQEGTWVAVS